MAMLARWAVVQWLKFGEERSAAQLAQRPPPAGALSWKVGPDLAASTNPARAAATIWGSVGSFRSHHDAEQAFESPASCIPSIAEAKENWRALLVPFAHRGECNHLNPEACGLLFEAQEDPGGPLLVMTTAGFDLRAKSDFQRLIHFRRRVEAMRPTIEAADGNLAHQVFVPLQPRDDGITMSLWQDEKSMFSFAYRPGAHRAELDRQNSHRTVDRSSFTRFRVLRSAGEWGGANPLIRENASTLRRAT